MRSVHTIRRISYISRIRAAYRRISDNDKRNGEHWYQGAFDYAQQIHPDVIKGAGVIAALSPRTQWDVNKDIAKQVIDAYMLGETKPPKLSTNDRLMKAWRILSLEAASIQRIVDILHGPKSTRFFLNIIGDANAVTVDTWANRIATNTEKPVRPGPHYQAIESAYQSVARKVGIAPRELQAILWCSIKRQTETSELEMAA